MNTPFFIAKRYLFSKKSNNVINVISKISIFGITISTAAMVIVLSAFNGIEDLVLSIFNSFESDIKIEAKHSKTFYPEFVSDKVFDDQTIQYSTHVIEETVIIKHYEQFAFATLKGVDTVFLKMVEIEKYNLDGEPILKDEYGDMGMAGVGLLQKLGGYIYPIDMKQYDYFTIFSPNRNEKIKKNNLDAFQTSKIPISSTFSFNNKIDESYLIVPLDFATRILDYGKEISAVEINYLPGTNIENKKNELENIVGEDFKITTAYEQNELIYKTSRSEKWLTIVLLGFIFFLGTFTMIASITMLVLEKKANLQTLFYFGTSQKQLQNVFFYLGFLINGLGVLFGLLLGYFICYLQIQFGLLKMEGGMVEYFPISIYWSDFFLIFLITLAIGGLAAFLPSKFLIKRVLNLKNNI